MVYIARHITSRVQKLLESFPCIVVTGARQVGKSTLISHLFPSSKDYVVFDPVTDIENARRDPDLFLDHHGRPLILDEIQYVPELIPAIKRRIDVDRSPGQYIITGSQQWGVLTKIAESLAGRAVFVDLQGFSRHEIAGVGFDDCWLQRWLTNPQKFVQQPIQRMESKRTLLEQLWHGSLPQAHFLTDDLIPDFYQGYLQTYIERDVRLLAEVSDWQLFRRFVGILAALTAQQINASQLGRELGISPQTARRWADILKATFQWFEVPPFTRNMIKRISNKPKGYLADTGIACTAQVISSPRAIASHPMFGALFETAVVGDIRRLCTVLQPRPNLYHWRTGHGSEVDLILEWDGKYYPIEIKAKSNPNRGDTTGLSAFRRHYPDLAIQPGLVIAATDTMIPLSENDWSLPWDAR